MRLRSFFGALPSKTVTRLIPEGYWTRTPLRRRYLRCRRSAPTRETIVGVTSKRFTFRWHLRGRLNRRGHEMMGGLLIPPSPTRTLCSANGVFEIVPQFAPYDWMTFGPPGITPSTFPY